jgi:hypothetical protein
MFVWEILISYKMMELRLQTVVERYMSETILGVLRTCQIPVFLK